MNAPPFPPCPVCARPLPVGHLDGMCPACAWQQMAAGTGEPEAPETPAADGLFHVPGHAIIEELARGGAGIVYRARQYQPSREVALKMLQPQQMGSDEMVARFRIEAETIAALDHPAILPVYTVGMHQEMPFFTMKLALGGTLAGRRVAYRGAWRRTAELLATLADAVHFAHSRGVIHRDLKPGNILFDEADRPFVSDFGLAKFTRADAPVTRTQTLMGTPAYLAPEVARLGAHAATTAADVYALGSILYELLAQRPPFAADSLPALLRVIAEDAPVPPQRAFPNLPSDLEVICLRALAKEPAHRFATAAELAAELRRWLTGLPILSRPISSGERLWRWCRRRPALAGLGAALTVTLLGAGVAQILANRSLSRALAATRAAEGATQVQLHSALVSEATLRTRSHQPGQRDAALELIARAVRIKPDLAARNAAAAALARDELRPGPDLPATFPEQATAIDFAPDLATYLTPTDDGRIALRRAEDGGVVRTYHGPGRSLPRQLRFNRDGRLFAVVYADRTTVIWQTAHPEPAWTLAPLRAGSTPFALHPTALAVAYWDSTGEVRQRDLTDGAEREIARELRQVLMLSFDPTGQRLAVVRTPALEVIAVADGKPVWSQAETVLGLPPVWSADGRHLLTGNRGRTAIDVRDAATGAIRNSLAGHSSLPHAMAFLGRSQRVLSLGFDGTLHLWDTATGRVLLQAPARARGLTVSPDGRRLAFVGFSGLPAVHTWAEAAVWREFGGEARPGTIPAGLALSDNGAWLATGAIESLRRENTALHLVQAVVWDTQRETTAGRVQFWSGRDDRVTLGFEPGAGAFVYSSSSQGIRRRPVKTTPAGRFALGDETVATAAGRGFLQQIERSGDWIVRLPQSENPHVLWPKGDAARATPLTLAGQPLRSAATVEARHILTRFAAGSAIEVWTRGDETRLGTVAAPSPAWTTVSPAGDRLVLLGGGAFRVHSLPGLDVVAEWPVRDDGSGPRMFAFSPTGRWFACEREGGALELRDGRTFDLQVSMEPPQELDLGGLVWAPDEAHLYAAYRGPRVFVLAVSALRRELATRGLDW